MAYPGFEGGGAGVGACEVGHAQQFNRKFELEFAGAVHAWQKRVATRATRFYLMLVSL